MEIKLTTEGQGPREKEILQFLKQMVKGQDRALKYVAQAWSRHNSPVRDTNKPICSILLAGQSSVGKLTTVQALAKHLFHDPDGFVYVNCSNPFWVTQSGLDMAHYTALAESHEDERKEVSSLVDELKGLEAEMNGIATKGKELEDKIKEDVKEPNNKKAINKLEKEYQALSKNYAAVKKKKENLDERFHDLVERGRDEGWLYSKKNPSNKLLSIVVFDKIEKAGEEFLDYIVELIDRGVVYRDDSRTSFRNSFVFLTTNAGGEEISGLVNSDKTVGFHGTPQAIVDQKIYDTAKQAINNSFQPDLLSRLDKIAVYRPLSAEVIMEILESQIEKLNEHLKKTWPVTIKLDPAMKSFITKRATKYAVQGARLLNAKITNCIKNKLAILYQTNQVKKGDVLIVKLEGAEDKEEPVFYKASNNKKSVKK